MAEHGATIHRAVRLLTLLRGKRVLPPRATLARDLGVCERQLYRYLNEAEAAGWPMPARRESEAV